MNGLNFDPAVHAARQPDALAIVEAATGRTLTYRELVDQSSRLANLWWRLGVRAGDHVAAFMESGVDLATVYWAAIRSGVYFTAVNDRLTAEEAAYIVDNSDARILIVADATAGRAVRSLASAPKVEHCLTFGAPAEGLTELVELMEAESPNWERNQTMGRTMFYSSGSTGRPKGVKRELSGRLISEGGDQVRELKAVLDVGPGDVYASTAPLYHAAAATYIDAMIANGATVVLMPRFDPETFLDAVERYRITLVQFVPTMMVRLLKLPEEVRSRADVSSVRAIVHGAGPCPPDAKRAFIDWFGPIVYEYYGGTEDCGHTVITSEEWLERPGSVGRPGPGVRMRIVDEDGLEVAVGETGLVYFDSDDARSAFSYHGMDPQNSTSHHPDHPTWATMGDIGHLDEDGYLYLTERRGHMIVRGGVNVYPREVEEGLLSHPDVADVAVFGVPNADLGEEVVAVVQLAPGVSADDGEAGLLREHARDVMAHYKAPARIRFTDRMPRAETGKLNKNDLRDWFLAEN